MNADPALGHDHVAGDRRNRGVDGGTRVARGEPTCPGDGREALVALADLGVSGPERDGHVDDPYPGPAGRLDRGRQPRQVPLVAGEAIDDALLHVHDE